MKEIVILECIYGYEFELKNNQITYAHVEGPDPKEQEVLPLFHAIRAKRNQAIEYLQNRSQPIDIAEQLWQAAEKAQCSAVQAENLGNPKLAQNEWQRSVRLFAGAAKACGALDPHIPWPEWVAGYAMVLNGSSGDSKKV